MTRKKQGKGEPLKVNWEEAPGNRALVPAGEARGEVGYTEEQLCSMVSNATSDDDLRKVLREVGRENWHRIFAAIQTELNGIQAEIGALYLRGYNLWLRRGRLGYLIRQESDHGDWLDFLDELADKGVVSSPSTVREDIRLYEKRDEPETQEKLERCRQEGIRPPKRYLLGYKGADLFAEEEQEQEQEQPPSTAEPTPEPQQEDKQEETPEPTKPEPQPRQQRTGQRSAFNLDSIKADFYAMPDQKKAALAQIVRQWEQQTGHGVEMPEEGGWPVRVYLETAMKPIQGWRPDQSALTVEDVKKLLAEGQYRILDVQACDPNAPIPKSAKPKEIIYRPDEKGRIETTYGHRSFTIELSRMLVERAWGDDRPEELLHRVALNFEGGWAMDFLAQMRELWGSLWDDWPDWDESKAKPREGRTYHLTDDEARLEVGEQPPAGEGDRGYWWFAFTGSRQIDPSQARPGAIRVHMEEEIARELCGRLAEEWHLPGDK
jgi:hypothetical protein